MSGEPNTTEDITPPIVPTAPWRIAQFCTLPGFRLAVEFMDGTTGEVDLSSLVMSENAGVFATLRDPEIFARARLEYGAILWPGDIDIAPDAMYDEIRSRAQHAAPLPE
jgi:Protein of unknown function (DUF2442)